jgi:protein CMS1
MSSDAPTSSGLAAKVNKKRKRQAEEPPKQNKTGASKLTSNASEGPKDKKRKQGKNKKEKKDTDQEDKPKVIRGEPLAKERKGGMDEAIGKMDGRLLADHFVQKAKRHNKELTAVELSDLSVPGMVLFPEFYYVQFTKRNPDSAFLDTSSFNSPRTLEKLPDFLKAFSPKGANLSDSSEQKGTPHTLVVSPAGLRAADVVRYESPSSGRSGEEKSRL